MAIDFTKLAALQEQAAEQTTDFTKAREGGGDYVPPAAGAVRLRLIGYIEQGTQATTWQGQEKKAKKATLLFECSGPKHPPREFDGKQVPHVLSVDITLSNHVKSGAIKLFNKLRQGNETARNFIDLLGKPFRGVVTHNVRKLGDREVTFANLKNGEGEFQIYSPTFEDPETGELKTLAVAEAITPMKVFIWDLADTEQWDSIFIDGASDSGKSRNKYQEKIKGALDFVGSPIYEALIAAGRDAELERATQVEPDTEGGDDEGGTKKSVVTETKKVLDQPEDVNDDPLAATK